MSTVELAVKKVQGLSETEASALLDWLAQQKPRARASKPSAKPRRKPKRQQTIADLNAWYDSIRRTTDWEPPRMPDDLVQRVKL
ncbi:hypothetical protein LBMAG56_22390 [Verrucomicrobiota bacterium]|nr:hypothetical protein LBMAG56_22390 [Verrucomicrobiota bacterium]